METTRTTPGMEEPENTTEGVGTTSASPADASRMRAASWRGQTGLRRALHVIGALFVVVLFVIAIAPTDDKGTTADHGQDTPNTQRTSDKSTDQQYEPRDEDTSQDAAARGQQLDQPAAVPGYQWQGWNRYRDGRCAWIPTSLLTDLSPVGTPRPTSTSCIVSLSDGTTIRITWGPPQTPAQWTDEGGHDTTRNTSDERRNARVTTIAGLEAHATRPIFLFLFFPGLCRLDLNTRSTTGLSILAWHPIARDDRCHTAETAATLIAHALIPTAGGTPWNDTPQQPTVASLAGRGPCELLSTSITRLNDLDDLDSDRIFISDSDHNDAECELTQAGVQVRAWLTSTNSGTTNARDNPAAPKADGHPRQLGSLRAFEKGSSKRCVVEAELLPDYALGVSYETASGASTACSLAELVAATAVQTLLERS
jgi:hypothetical protein